MQSISPALFAITWKVWEIQSGIQRPVSSANTLQSKCWSGHTFKLRSSPFQCDHSSEQSEPTDVTAMTPLFIERVVLLLLLQQHHYERQSSPVTARGTHRHEEEVQVNKSQRENPCRAYSEGNTTPSCFFFQVKCKLYSFKSGLAFAGGHWLHREFTRVFWGNSLECNTMS